MNYSRYLGEFFVREFSRGGIFLGEGFFRGSVFLRGEIFGV